ncbi:YadA-like family protein [Pseudomonas sp. 1912-s]|uniref:YadA-like family protein n=1 Tax=Pseudomonas sp. 1912-s TaxID=3033802 RepID=UPI0023E0034D|nr:YadA-like family protein [Pseudomonas sp. 1912-s]MDF3201815.1 YadA-like family protein [Pseudomonas sp. 1912-s]
MSNNAFALGNNITIPTGLDGAVVLGNNSTVAASTPTANATINGVTYTFAGAAPAAGGVLSVGAVGNERQVTNLAAGRVTGTSTDAVNGSQLFATNTAVNGVGTTLNNIVNNGAGIKFFHANSTLADSTATGTNSVAVGPTANATAINAMALGNGATAGTANSVALGSGATTAAANATTGGTVNGTAYTYAGGAPIGVLSLGTAGTERQITNVAAGRVTGTSTDVVNGSQLFATNTAVNSVGTTLNNIVSNGAGIKYFHANSTAADSSAVGIDSVAVGPLAVSNGATSTAVGSNASAAAAESSALGANSSATGVRSISVGNTSAAGDGSIAIGGTGSLNSSFKPTATGADAIAIGASNTQAFGSRAVSVGRDSWANGDNSASFGYNSEALGLNAAAFGTSASADADNSLAVGPNAKATATNATALGSGAIAGTANSVALGSGATTDAANATTGGTINGTAYTYAGGAPIGVLSLGTAGNERQITNVAAGQVTGISTDAVNGSQLFATNTAVNSVGTTLNNIVTNGAGIKYFHTNSTLADSTATGTNSVAVGPTANATATNAMALGNGATAGTANSVALGTGATTVAANATAGGTINGTAFTYAGGAPIGVLSLGSAGNERQITNVAAGRVTGTSTDAVNGSQLFATNTAVDGLGTSVNNIVNNGAGIKYFHANSTLADSTATGTNSVAVGPTASATATNAMALGNGATAGTANSVALGSGATTAAANATAGGTINGTAYTYAGGAPIGVLSLGSAGNERQITNVAAGRVTGTSTDAVNGSQLFATNTAVNGVGTTLNNIVNNGSGIKYFHTNSTLADSTASGINSVAVGPAASATASNAMALGNGATAGTANSVALGSGATTAAANATTGGTINGTAFTYAGGAPIGVLSLGSAGNERQITNVAAARVTGTSTDAVNGSQLFATNTAVDGIGTSVNNIVNGAGIKYFHTNSTLADSTATGTDSVAIGPNASSTATNAMALGNGATAGTANSIALGSGATTAAANATTGGTVNGSAYTYAGGAPAGVLSVGSAGNERQITNVAAGQVTAASTDAVNGSQLFATNTAVDGLGTSVNNIVNGAGIKYFHTNSTLADSTATGTDSVAVGPSASATATNAIALGNGATAGTANSIALGSGATTAAANATTGGTVNGTAYTYAGGAPTGVLSVGSAGNERQITNVAAGQVTGTSTDAVNGSQLFATNTAVDGLGTSVNNIVNNGTGIKYFHANSTLADSSATGVDSVAIGPQSVAGGAQSFAAGAGAAATTAGSVALGNQSSVQVLGGVALGQGSVSDRAIAPSTGLIPVGNGAIRYDTSDATLLGAVSLGKAGQYRQLTNVADGTSSQDAVTLRQLTGAIGSISATGTMYFHANSTNPQDSLSVGQESIAVGPATVVNGDNGIGIGNQATVGQAAAGGIAIGRNTQVLLASGIAIGSQAEAQGEQSLALGAGAVASQATSIALGSSSVTTVGAQNGYTAYGLSAPQTSVGELGIGTASGNRKITGVAAGSAPNDAVNVEQLTAVGDQVAQNTTNITNLGGRVTTIEGNINNITNGGGVKYFHANSTQADSVASGTDSVAIGGNASASGNGAVASGTGAQASGTAAVASGNGAQATGAGAVAVGNGATASADGSVAVGQGSSDNGRGAETYNGKYSNASNASVGTVSVGNTATGQTRTVSNVADGQQATDAVNLRQLDGAVAESKQYTDDSLKTINTNVGNVTGAITAVDNRVTQVESNVSKVQNGTDGMFQVNNTSTAAKPSATGTNAVAGGAGSVASGNNSAAVGTNAKASGANSVAMGNGASATGSNSTALGANSVASRDNSVSVGAAGSERQITNVAAATQGTDAVNFDQLNKSVSNITDNVNAYTDQRYSELKRDLKKQDDTLSAGIAGAMAMASLPQPYSPGASMTSIAAANYRGQSALSFGVSTISKNGHWVGKLQATTNTQGDAGVGVGVGYQW